MICNTCNSYLSTEKCKLCNKAAEGKKVIKIRKMSKSLAAKTTIYKRLRIEFLKDKRCAVYPYLRATEVHHAKGRNSYLNDVGTWVAVSREGHIKIESNPNWAREKGFTKSRL